jgi:RHS repeat-associated protein
LGDLATVDGPLSGSADTIKYRYNAGRERIGTISPDPDGGGLLKPRAERVTIGSAGLVTKVESGNVASQSDSDWAGFTPVQAVETGYDGYFRPVSRSLTSGSTVYALTETNYDDAGRVYCVAVRMTVLTASGTPCSQSGTAGSYGPDRIVRTTYTAAGEVYQTTSAYGTIDQSNDATYSYTSNGLLSTVTDAETNKTTYGYDGFDRRVATYYPSATQGAGTSDMGHYDLAILDPNGNATTFGNRAGDSIGYVYDALNRVTFKDAPGNEPDVTYGYDLLGRVTTLSQAGYAQTFGYDALGRRISQTEPRGSYGLEHDLAGRLTRLTWPDAFYVTYDYLVTGEVTQVREAPAGTGLVLATLGYDPNTAAGQLGRRTGLTYGSGETAAYAYDPVLRVSQLQEHVGGGNDLTLGFTYNPASQIVQNTRSNDLYSWTGHGSGTTSYQIDGLNRIAKVDATPLGYDANGNTVNDGAHSFGYDSQNHMTVPGAGAAFRYDGLGQVYELDFGGSVSRYYDRVEGDELTHVSASNNVQRRFVYLPGETGPIVWYEGSGTASRRYHHQDERGSTIAMTSQSGALLYAPTSYDEYGRTGGPTALFSYTGQESFNFGQNFKARFYNPQLGRFLSPDPIGYGAGMNMYGYVGGDPVNRVDPTGLCGGPSGTTPDYPGENCEPIVVNGKRPRNKKEDEDDAPIIVLAEGTESTAQAVKRLSAGPILPAGCSMVNGSNGAYMRCSDTKIHLTPKRQREVCRDFHKLMKSNTQVGAATWGVGGLSFVKSFPGPASVMNFMASGVTVVLSFAPTPPGCE